MTVRWTVILDPFLGNDALNTFPWQGLGMQLEKCSVTYTVRAEEIKRIELWQPSSFESWQSVLCWSLEGRT
jgi:hypothetical protein